jgi:hypothetical protein
MPRRRGAENREVASDPVYGSTLVEKFICSMMWDGKKQTAQKIFYTSMKKLEERGGGEEAIKLKYRRPAGPVWRFAGFSATLAVAPKKAWPTSSPTS